MITLNDIANAALVAATEAVDHLTDLAQEARNTDAWRQARAEAEADIVAHTGPDANTIEASCDAADRVCGIEWPTASDRQHFERLALDRLAGPRLAMLIEDHWACRPGSVDEPTLTRRINAQLDELPEVCGQGLVG